MVASILKNRKAIQVNISIVRAFVTLRQFASEFTELNLKLETNMQFNDIYQALTELASKQGRGTKTIRQMKKNRF